MDSKVKYYVVKYTVNDTLIFFFFNFTETVQLIQLVFYAWSAFWEVFTKTIDIGLVMSR